jgi:hypothetical protein
MGETPIVVRVKAVNRDRQSRKVHVMNILANHPEAALQVAHHTIAKRVNEAQVRALKRSLRATRHTDRRAQPTR